MSLLRAIKRLFTAIDIQEPIKPILVGYTIREGDIYTEMDIESLLVRRIIPYKLKPNDVIIWAHYSDHSYKKVDFLNYYTCFPELKEKEKEEVEAALETYKKENEESKKQFKKQKKYYADRGNPIQFSTGNYMCSGLVYSSGPYLHPIEQLRKELVDKINQKNRDWKREYYNQYKKNLKSNYV